MPATRCNADEANTYEKMAKHPDLVIIAGSGRPSDKAGFLVSAKTLCQASHILRALVHRCRARRPTARRIILRLPNDEPRSLRIILSILHNRSEAVPLEPSTIDLYYILLSVAKYNLSKIIRPWAPYWLTCARNADPSESSVLLFIAWQLGDANLVLSQINHWIKHAIDTKDGLATRHGQPFSRRPVVAEMDACRRIVRVRRYLVERALNLWHTTINGLKHDYDTEADNYPFPMVADLKGDQPCTAFVLGCLIQHEWKTIGDTLPTDCRDYSGQVYHLAKLITGAQDGGSHFCTRPMDVHHHCRYFRLVARMKREYARAVGEAMGGLPREWEMELAHKAKLTGSMMR